MGAQNSSLAGVTLPPISRKRGRPKVSVLLKAIRLPKKRRCPQDTKPKAFLQKEKQQRDLQLLCLFVSVDDAKRALNGQKLSEETVEQMPAFMSNACLDEDVAASLSQIRPYFDADGWQAVEHIFHAVRSTCTWMCETCKIELVGVNYIACLSCRLRYHLKCVGKRNSKQKSRTWFCHDCNSHTN